MAELVELAKKYGTDKWGPHFYAPHYERHFAPFRNERFNLLEIGIGGYREANAGGASVLMWREYFPNATIVAIDIHEKRIEGERIKVFRGDQADPDFLIDVHRRAGPFRIIVDDGSHVSSHVIRAFQCLFPLLELGGIYAIEDLQTSYWALYGGNMYDLQAPATSMQFLKSLADALNYQERDTSLAPPTQVERHTVGVHFYHNLCFVEKGNNDEPSNIAGARIDVPAVLPPEMCERVRGKSDAQLEPILSMLGGADGILRHVAAGLEAQFRHATDGTTVLGRAVVQHGSSVLTLEIPLQIQRRRFAGGVPVFEARMSAYDWMRLLAGNLSNIPLLSGRASIRDDHCLLPDLAAGFGRRGAEGGAASR
jgi:hypothetical protein